jgi:hypothetical protein
VGGVLQFGYGFHTSGTHRHNDARDELTTIAESSTTNAGGSLPSREINEVLLREKKNRVPFYPSLEEESIPAPI